MRFSFARAALLVTALLITKRSHASDRRPTARLELLVSPDAAPCVNEADLRSRVATRLGYDPFVSPAAAGEPASAPSPTFVRIRFSPSGSRVVAQIDVTQGGEPAGRRKLEEARNRCEPLLEAVAAAVAIAIDPIGPREPTAVPAPIEPAPEKPEASSPPAPAAVPPPPPPPAGPPIVPWLAFEAVASVAVAPGPTVGGQLGAGLRYGLWSLGIEGRAETQTASATLTERDRADATLYSGAIVPCRHVGWVALCLGGRGGSLQATAVDVSRPTPTSSLFGAFFTRLALEIPALRDLALRISLEGGVPIVRRTLSVGGTPVWTAPPAYGAVAFGVVWRLQ